MLKWATVFYVINMLHMTALLLPYQCGPGYVSTANLDGETNLKLKTAPQITQEKLTTGALMLGMGMGMGRLTNFPVKSFTYCWWTTLLEINMAGKSGMLVVPGKMVISHSYVSLQEGRSCKSWYCKYRKTHHLTRVVLKHCRIYPWTVEHPPFQWEKLTHIHKHGNGACRASDCALIIIFKGFTSMWNRKRWKNQ